MSRSGIRVSRFLITVLALCHAFPAQAADNPDIAKIRAAAEQGDATAQAKLGFSYYQGQGVPKDNVEAAKWMQKAAEQGNVFAEGLLGIMYVNGDGVSQNYAEAAKWDQKAADKGLAVAQSNLAALYHEGTGVAKDIPKAEALYRQAAEQGNADAQTALGYMLLQEPGNVIPKDPVQGYMWLILAAEQHSSQAIELQKAVQSSLTPEQIAKAQQQSQAWAQQHVAH